MRCAACIPGMYQEETGEPSCKSCQIGYFTDDYSQISCRPCQAGLTTRNEGDSVCGKYAGEPYFVVEEANIKQDGSGESQFLEVRIQRGASNSTTFTVLALPGTPRKEAENVSYFATAIGSMPVGKHEAVVRVSGIRYGTKYYVKVRSSISEHLYEESVHNPCPENAWCNNPDADSDIEDFMRGSIAEEIVPNDGYWQARWNNFSFIECKFRGACRGYVGSGANKGKYGCNEEDGYSGVLCHTCRDGFSRSRDNECKPCMEMSGWLFAGGILGVALFVAYFVRRVRIANRRRLGVPKRREVELMKVMVNGMYGLGALASYPLTFPKQMDGIFNVGRQISSLSGEVLSSECFLDSADGNRFFRVQLVIMILPLSAVALSASFWFFVYRVKLCVSKCSGDGRRGRGRGRRSGGKDPDQIRLNAWVNFVISCLVIFFLGIPSLNRSSMKMVICEEVGSTGKLRLSAQMDMECFMGEHLFWFFALALPSLLLYSVFIPLVGVTTLVRLRRQGKLWRSPGDASKASVYMFLYVGFRKESFYWEFIILLRKLMLNFVMMMSSRAIALGLLALGVFFGATALHMDAQPYRDAFMNKMESWVLILTAILLFSGLFLYDNPRAQVLSVCIVVISFTFCFSYVIIIAITAIQARMRAVRKCMPWFTSLWDLLDRHKDEESDGDEESDEESDEEGSSGHKADEFGTILEHAEVALNSSQSSVRNPVEVELTHYNEDNYSSGANWNQYAEDDRYSGADWNQYAEDNRYSGADWNQHYDNNMYRNHKYEK